MCCEFLTMIVRTAQINVRADDCYDNCVGHSLVIDSDAIEKGLRFHESDTTAFEITRSCLSNNECSKVDDNDCRTSAQYKIEKTCVHVKEMK